MWWQRSSGQGSGVRGQVIACILALALSACGFRPMYGDAAHEAAEASGVQGNIEIAPIGGGRFGQVLKNALEDKFNPQGIANAQPDYKLSVSFNRQVVPSVVRSDGTILRYDVRFDTTYTLASGSGKFQPQQGSVRRISSYNVVPNANFATYEAEQSLNERMLKEIAEDYVLRISGLLAGK